jgi:hypothetical protein
MSTLLFVIGILIGTLAIVVLAALLRAAGLYLCVRWRDQTRRKKEPARDQTVRP